MPQGRMYGHLTAQKTLGPVAEPMTHGGAANPEQTISLAPSPQAPLGIDVVDEQIFPHSTDGVQRRHGNQTPGSDQVIHLDDSIGSLAIKTLDARVSDPDEGTKVDLVLIRVSRPDSRDAQPSIPQAHHCLHQL